MVVRVTFKHDDVSMMEAFAKCQVRCCDGASCLVEEMRQLAFHTITCSTLEQGTIVRVTSGHGDVTRGYWERVPSALL